MDEAAEAKRLEDIANAPYDWGKIRIDIGVKTALPRDHHPPIDHHDNHEAELPPIPLGTCMVNQYNCTTG